MIKTSLEDFEDIKTFEIVNSFCQELEENNTHLSVLRHYSSIRKSLENTSVDDINAATICKKEQNGQIENKADMRDFLIYCAEKNLLNDSEIFLRLNNFERGDFTESPNRNNIYASILQGDFYEKFTARKNLPFSKIDRTVYLRQLACTFADEAMHTEAEQFYLEGLKLSNHTSATILHNCELFQNMVNSYLCQIHLADFNRANVLNNLFLVKNSTQLNILNQFIAYLHSKNIFPDPDYGRFITDIIIPCHGIKRDKYKELISSPQLNRCFLNVSEKKGHEIYRCDIKNEELYNAVKCYVSENHVHVKKLILYFTENFEHSARADTELTLENLDFKTYLSQIDYFSTNSPFSRKNTSLLVRILSGFWLFVHTQFRNNLFAGDGIDPKILQLKGLGKTIAEGYRVVQYNPYEDVPAGDKWIAVITNQYAANSDITGTTCFKLDFSSVSNAVYRTWIKTWFWKSNLAFSNKKDCYKDVKRFLNYVEGVHNGSIPSIYALPTADNRIRIEDCASYKNYIISHWGNNRTRSGRIYNARGFMKYIDENRISEVHSGVFRYLSYTLSTDYDNTRALTNEEYKKILELMKKNADNGINENLSLIVFCLAIETEFRSSQIFSLKTGCVRETGVKTGEYVLVSKTKNSNGEEIEQPITAYTKRRLDEIERITQPYRDACPSEDMKTLLFIVPGKGRKNTFRVFDNKQFNPYLQKCCTELGLPMFSFNNLRDTHMTRSEKFIAEKGLSPIHQNVLSGHSSPDVDTRNYSDMSTKDLMESVYGIIFGNVDITGRIVDKAPEASSEEENCVSCGRGYCTLSQCTDRSTIDCMLCSHFCTTVDREPYFDEAVRQLDAQISQILTSPKRAIAGTENHDIQDLTKRKELCLAYKLAINEYRNHKQQEVKS